MATITIEKRLSVVEAELAEIKRRLNGNGIHTTSAAPDKNGNGAAPLRTLTIGEKFAAIRAQNSEAWDDLPSDLAEQHDHYIYGWPKK